MMIAYWLELKPIPHRPIIPLWVQGSANKIQAMQLVEDIKHCNVIAFIPGDGRCPIY
jgi:hypothetical protein